MRHLASSLWRIWMFFTTFWNRGQPTVGHQRSFPFALDSLDFSPYDLTRRGFTFLNSRGTSCRSGNLRLHKSVTTEGPCLFA